MKEYIYGYTVIPRKPTPRPRLSFIWFPGLISRLPPLPWSLSRFFMYSHFPFSIRFLFSPSSFSGFAASIVSRIPASRLGLWPNSWTGVLERSWHPHLFPFFFSFVGCVPFSCFLISLFGAVIVLRRLSGKTEELQQETRVEVRWKRNCGFQAIILNVFFFFNKRERGRILFGVSWIHWRKHGDRRDKKDRLTRVL